MKTVITSTLLALTVIAGISGSANAAYDGYPSWAQQALEHNEN